MKSYSVFNLLNTKQKKILQAGNIEIKEKGSEIVITIKKPKNN
jgi:hypothetical protein